MSSDRSPGKGTSRRADGLVMFGLTGDLGEKKLLPALRQLAAADRLGIPVIGVGRSSMSDDELRSALREANTDADDELLDSIDLSYLQGDSQDDQTYADLAERLSNASSPVIYCALPPDLFAGVGASIDQSPLPSSTRLVLEKPFGDGAENARHLHDEVTASVPADQIFLVDHFLAKASIENLLTFRTANPIIEHLLRPGVVDHVQVTMAESFGADGRGSFYESVGASKDVVQNHLLQLIAVLTMEPPPDTSTEAYDRGRAEVIDAIEPLRADDIVLGQYEGYRDLDGVDDDSEVETFMAARLAIDTSRWRGVPIVLRTGKEMEVTATEAIVSFNDDRAAGSPNLLRFRVKPESAITFEMNVLDPNDHGTTNRSFDICPPAQHGPLGDYATMLDGAMDGDHRHFARIEDVVASWHVIDVLRRERPDVHRYESGSMGPSEAAALLPHGLTWIDLSVD